MSNNRYSSLNRRPAATSTLFDSYPGSRPSSSSSFNNTSTTQRNTSPYPPNNQNPNGNPYSYAQPGASSHSQFQSPPGGFGAGTGEGGYRPATPNSRGQYSASVLESLESQNDTTATTLLSQKVSQLKSLTVAIGDEIRDSSVLAGTINEGFEGAGVRLRGTMKRMLRMAERTGVGWRVWLGFFVCVWVLFAWVWLF